MPNFIDRNHTGFKRWDCGRFLSVVGIDSRSTVDKDYYDLYIIYKLKDKDVNTEILVEACRKTFRDRKTEFDIDKIVDLLVSLKTNEAFLKRQ